MKKKPFSLSVDDVQHIAQLAHLPLQHNQVELFRNQLSKTLSYVQQLDDVLTNEVEPVAQITGLTNVFRKDEIKSSLSQQEALRNAQASYKGYFKVKSVFEKYT